MLGKKLGHLVKSKENLVYALEATFSMKSGTNLKMGHVWSKTRSPCQILEKPCVHPRE